MKRALVASLLVLVAMSATVGAAKPTPSGTIVLNESGPFKLGDTVTFTTTVDNLTGSQWPMVYVVCIGADGIDPDTDPDVLYGQLDQPDTVFVLGGGWSPWRDRPTEDVTCHAELWYFNKQHVSTVLAVTPTFAASGA